MKIIERPQYMKMLLDAVGTPDIKIITGIRRCGKSVLLESLADCMREANPNANIIRVNYNLLEFEELAEYHALYRYIEESYCEGVPNVVMIDEVQTCIGFEKAINSLHASGKYDIYLTGSNAFLLSSDLATLFRGRTYEVEVLPFSLSEFSAYYEISDPDAALDRYLREGGMPGSYLYPNEQARYRYIANVLDVLILRDVEEKHRVRNKVQLERACDFLMDNIGNIASVNGIAAALDAAGTRISVATLAQYLGYLCHSFAFYRVRRYDVAGKKYLTSGDKYYLADHAIRYAKLGTKKLDFGRVYENMVAMELLRRGWEIYVGVLYKKEIDFVAVRRDERVYIQVSDDISRQETFEREVAPLLAIRDAYPKMVIARTKHEATDYEGIQVIDIARWLMGKEGSAADQVADKSHPCN